MLFPGAARMTATDSHMRLPGGCDSGIQRRKRADDRLDGKCTLLHGRDRDAFVSPPKRCGRTEGVARIAEPMRGHWPSQYRRVQ